jgi:hypothetical protein
MNHDNIPESLSNDKTREVDLLVYKGNKVPKLLKIAWVILILFCIWYLISFMVPDLKVWIQKL